MITCAGFARQFASPQRITWRAPLCRRRARDEKENRSQIESCCISLTRRRRSGALEFIGAASPGAVAFMAVAVHAAIAAAQVLPLPAEDQHDIAKMLGAGVVGEALPSVPISDVALYFPLEERVMTYQVTSGPNAGQMQNLEVAKGKRPGGNPAWRFGLSSSLAAFLRQTAGGDLYMPAVSDSGEGVVIVTTPPNPFLLNGMKPGATRTVRQSVAVNYLDDPTDRRYSGTLTAKFTYVGTYQVTVPAGTYQAILIRFKTDGKVGPAHTTDTAYYFFAPHVGVVAMISQQDVEAFWIIHIDSRSGKVLASAS